MDTVMESISTEQCLVGSLNEEKSAEIVDGVIEPQAKKKVWGPIIPERRSKRVPQDGATMLSKAQNLKKKKNLEVDKGVTVEGFQSADLENCSHDPELEYLMSRGKGSRLHEMLGQTQSLGHKTPRFTQVINEAEQFLYKTGNDWKASPIPGGANGMMITEDLEKIWSKKKWINLTAYGAAWGM